MTKLRRPQHKFSIDVVSQAYVSPNEFLYVRHGAWASYSWSCLCILGKFVHSSCARRASAQISNSAPPIRQGASRRIAANLGMKKQTWHRQRAGVRRCIRIPARKYRAVHHSRANSWAPSRQLPGLAGADKSTPGHFTDPSQASQGPTYTATAGRVAGDSGRVQAGGGRCRAWLYTTKLKSLV